MNMENLNESIKKILLNIQYDTKLTLKENFDEIVLLEQPRANFQKIDDLKTAFGDLAGARAQFELAMTEAKLLKLLNMDLKNFEDALVNAAKQDLKAGVPVGTIGPNLKEISKVDAIRRITDKVAREKRTSPLTVIEVEAIKNATKADNIALTSKIKPPKPRPVKPTPPPVPPVPPVPVNPTWTKMKSWAKTAGYLVVGGAALYALYKWLNGANNEDEIIEQAKKCGYKSVEEYRAAGYKCPKDDNIVPPPQPPTRYRDCENEEVQTFGCKSSLVREVQDCLGVKTDSFWGPKTNTAISANASKFLGGFTKDDIKEICSSRTIKPTDREKIIDPEDVGAGLSSSTTTSDKSSSYNPNLMD